MPVLIILSFEHRSYQESCMAMESVDSVCGFELSLVFCRGAILAPLVNQCIGYDGKVNGSI